MSPVNTRFIAYDPESRYSVTFANVDSSIVSAFVYLRIDFTTSFNFMSFPSIFFCINHTFIDALSADFFFILYKYFLTTK